MKKLLGLLVGLFLTITTFAQGVVVYDNASTAEKSKKEGVFSFSFSSEYAKEDIVKVSEYYESYFKVTITPNDRGLTVVVKLVEDTEMARKVVTRFFVSLDVRAINVSGTSISIDDFITRYVMN